MKCLALKVTDKAKPGWPLVEFGGIYANHGDVILLKESRSARQFAKSYAPFLTDLGLRDVTNLKNGLYEIQRGKAKESAVAAPAEGVADKAADKSMANKGRRKAKSRRKG